MTQDWAKLFGLSDDPEVKKKKKTQIVDKLLQVPKKDKGVNAPRFQPVDAGITQQADLLFLPDDDGYKYCLVIVDIGNKFIDAVPLKSKEGDNVKVAFEKIYRRKILKIPKRMEIDSGSEFSEAKKWLKLQHVFVRVAKPGRHRQQAIVERVNQTIGKALFRRMSAQELLTGETSKEWVEDLPKLVSVLNAKAKKIKKKKVPKFGDPVCKGDACNLLTEGTKVRVILEQPKDPITGQKLTGKFRSTDQRWDPTIRIIKDIMIEPRMPPLYLLDGNVGRHKIEPVGYTKNQLQVVTKDEQYPTEEVIRGKPKTYIVQELIRKTRIKGKIYYEVRWRGFQQTTLEPRSVLLKDVPDIVKKFENNH